MRPITRIRVKRPMTRIRVKVGSPLQLLLLACSFALAGYAGVRLPANDWFQVALWFVGAALVHDLVLLPLYAVADRYPSATGLSGEGFLARWLLITAVLFGGSALLLVLRLRRATKQRPPAAH